MFFKLKIVAALFSLRRSRKRFAVNGNSVQQRRWKELQKILAHAPFYRELANRNAALLEYPVVNKQLFMQHFNEINTCAIDKQEAMQLAITAEQTRDFSPTLNGVTVGLSSGTSGNRGIFLASEKERAWWVGGILDRVIGFSLSRRTVAFFLRANSNLYGSVQSNLLQFSFFDLLGEMNTHVQQLNVLQPDILVAQPSVLMELARRKEQRELKINPARIISVAEVLYPEDAAYLQKVFGQIIHQVYQCTEGFLAATCEQGTLHFNEDFLIIEKKYLDEGRVRFHPVITDLIRQSQPVVRYELNDIIHEKKNCLCGSKMLAIEKIEGRSDDVLKFRSDTGQEVSIYPDYVRRAVILADESITEYQVVQQGANEIGLFTNGSEENFRRAQQVLSGFLQEKKISNVTIQQLNKIVHFNGNKFRRVINDYRKAT